MMDIDKEVPDLNMKDQVDDGTDLVNLKLSH